jgi:CDP-4-dehydro-6-deoxyglucose reductase
LADYPDLSGHQVYACGAPAISTRRGGTFTLLRALPADQLYADSFTYAAEKEARP